MFRALKNGTNYILLGLKTQWLHDASVIQRLVCKWLRREEKEERVGHLSI